MQITPKDGPATIMTSDAIKPQAVLSPRERAIQAVIKNDLAQQEARKAEQPVQNATQVSPEEMTAINPRSETQKHSTEDTVVTEAPVAESTEAEKPLSSQYAILARQQRALRQREQQLKARELAIKVQEESRTATPAASTPSFDPSNYVERDRLTKDPFGVLTDLGLSYDQLTEMALNAPKHEQVLMNNEIKALRDELKALKSETEGTKKSLEEQQTQSYTQAVNQIKSEARNLIRSNPNFETIRETGSVGDVVELIEETFKKDGILLTVEEAAIEVEDYLTNELVKHAKIKKIQQRLAPRASTPVQSQGQTKQPNQMKTLTNALSSNRPMTAKERAIAAFEGKLGK
jgi:hypothetical protein